MSSEVPPLSEIISLLPRKLQLRFDSLGNYVRGMIEEETAKLGAGISLSAEEEQLIHLAVFIYSLDSFFRTGTNAARNTSITFEEFGFSGFQVGNAFFTQNNDNTLRGIQLANELANTVANTPLGRFIRNASSMKDLVSTLTREVNNGRIAD